MHRKTFKTDMTGVSIMNTDDMWNSDDINRVS